MGDNDAMLFRPSRAGRPGGVRGPSAAMGGLVRAVPAPFLVIAAGLSTYAGAGYAVALFALMPPSTVAWWRLVVGAVVLLAWRRPWRRPWTLRVLGTSAGFGVAMATMNIIFYAAIAHIDLGTAVSLEFLGPVIVALAVGRGWRPRLAAVLALAGVTAISGLGMDLGNESERLGVLLAVSAGLAWACYIVLGRRVAAAGAGIDALAVGSLAGALAYAPLAVPTAGAAFRNAGTFLAVLGVGVLSTVIPYALDQINLGRLRPDTFSLLLALMPATSLLVGVVMLGQVPGPWELIGLVLVSVAVALAGGRGPAAPASRPSGSGGGGPSGTRGRRGPQRRCG